MFDGASRSMPVAAAMAPGWRGEAVGPPSRLALAVVQAEDAPGLMERLARDGFSPVRIDAAGGFLRRDNAIVLAALGPERLPVYLEAVRATFRAGMVAWFPPVLDELVAPPTEPIEVEVGGAVVFVLPLEGTVWLGAPAGAEAALVGVEDEQVDAAVALMRAAAARGEPSGGPCSCCRSRRRSGCRGGPVCPHR